MREPTRIQLNWDQAKGCPRPQAQFQKLAAIPIWQSRGAIENQVAQRINNRPAVIEIQRLDAMGMGADDSVHVAIDQPSRQLALALSHFLRVFIAPMDETQNERRFGACFRDCPGDAFTVAGVCYVRALRVEIT